MSHNHSSCYYTDAERQLTAGSVADMPRRSTINFLRQFARCCQSIGATAISGDLACVIAN